MIITTTQKTKQKQKTTFLFFIFDICFSRPTPIYHRFRANYHGDKIIQSNLREAINNVYLERLTRTGPKRLHILYMYILSKFNAYNTNTHAPHTSTTSSKDFTSEKNTEQHPQTQRITNMKSNFLLQGQLSVLTLISVSVPPPCYRSST